MLRAMRLDQHMTKRTPRAKAPVAHGLPATKTTKTP
jgi:hypothetical protein